MRRNGEESDPCTEMWRKKRGSSDTVRQVAARITSLMVECQKAIEERDQALVVLNHASTELEQLHAIKNDLFAMLNNEFRSALLAIQQASEAIRDNDLSVTDAREFALDIYGDARHLLRMITDQLEFSSLATSQQLQQRWLNLNTIITDTVNRLRPLIHHPVRLQLARALPVLRGDHEKLTHVISHLLKNADHYSPDDGEILVNSGIKGHMVHVGIHCQGVELPVLVFENLFARRVCPEVDLLAPPLHGLPMVRDIVQMHGGEIRVESRSGAGSTIHFTIPFSEHHSYHHTI